MALKLVILDVDGCLCDGKIYDENHNTVGKVFNDLDFSAIKLFKALNIDVVLLTSDGFNIGMANKRNLNLFNGSHDGTGKIDKLAAYESIKKAYDVIDDEVAYLGDDRFDLPVMEKEIWAFCPSNSPRCVKDVCTQVLSGRSGQNLVSEMFEWFLEKGILSEPPLEQLIRIDYEEKK